MKQSNPTGRALLTWLHFALIALLACVVPLAHAADYPTRPIKLLVPLSAGSTTDIVARTVADRLSRRLGQTIIVENKTGAGGVVGRIDTHFANGENDRYGLDLTFAKDQAGAACRFCYSIEPMCPEPSEGFYKKFLRVKGGQKVRKGDVIAHLYTPPSREDAEARSSFMGMLGMLTSSLFTLLMIAQAIPTFIFDPCQQ